MYLHGDEHLLQFQMSLFDEGVSRILVIFRQMKIFANLRHVGQDLNQRKIVRDETAHAFVLEKRWNTLKTLNTFCGISCINTMPSTMAMADLMASKPNSSDLSKLLTKR